MKWLLTLLLLSGSMVMAQHNNRSGRDLQFNFGNPGARSLSFGGAFIGLADDATAPIANPAGAVRTHKRSMAFEINYNRQDNDIPFASGDILQTNIFEFEYNFTGGQAPESKLGLPFVAMIFPKENWRFGVFLHQQADFKREYENDKVYYCHLLSNGYPNCSDLGEPDSFFSSTEYLNVSMLNGGFSVARSLTENFSLGASVFYSTLDYQADSTILVEEIVGDAYVDRFARGEDTSFGAILGAMWQVTQELSLGMTYKIQPKFDYTASLSSTRPVPHVPDDFVTAAIFKIPDAVGFGIHISPLDQFSVNMDVNRVFYSQVTDDFVDFSQVSTSTGTIIQTMSDVTEIHVGMEYVYLGLANPLSLRLGYWLDPYHAPVNNVEDSQIFEGRANRPTIRDVFFLHQFEKDDNHYAAGLGYTFGERFQLDMAVDIGDSSKDATVSGIYRF